MGAIRALKRNKAVPTPYPVDFKEQLAAAYEKGFIQGSQQQREADIESTVTLLEGLEDIPGIGEKTAWKIREHVMRQFGNPS